MDTAKSIFPIYPFGSPFDNFIQVFPASTDLYIPPFNEPLIIVHGFLSALQDAAYIIFELSGANSTSTMPIESEINRIFFHDFPPSIVL